MVVVVVAMVRRYAQEHTTTREMWENEHVAAVSRADELELMVRRC